jgi:ABC-type Fe3+ transport system substrate-binding protein
MPQGHKPEFITGMTGYYACGGGTGQSDDIPAMLHDGDYVMDADVVAALGDGSSKAGREILEGFRKQVPHKETNHGQPVPAKIADGEYVFPAGFVNALGGGDNKAGAKVLDGLREKLRAHKRSAPTSKIPPKAKSPLDYIKQLKG